MSKLKSSPACAGVRKKLPTPYLQHLLNCISLARKGVLVHAIQHAIINTNTVIHMCNFTVFMSYSPHWLESMVNKTKHVNLNGNAVNCQLFSEPIIFEALHQELESWTS